MDKPVTPISILIARLRDFATENVESPMMTAVRDHICWKAADALDEIDSQRIAADMFADCLKDERDELRTRTEAMRPCVHVRCLMCNPLGSALDTTGKP